MAKYKHYDYAQNVLVPVSLEDQIVPGTLEFAIQTLIVITGVKIPKKQRIKRPITNFG